MPFYDLFADRQSNPVACVFFAGVQTLENDENRFLVLRHDADAVIGDRKYPLVIVLLGRDLDYGRSKTAKFYGVSYQILKHLLQLGSI